MEAEAEAAPAVGDQAGARAGQPEVPVGQIRVGRARLAEQLPGAQVAFAGIGDTATLTRLRAELGPAALDRDLQLAASADNVMLDRIYSYGTVRNTPPPYPTCEEMAALGITTPGGYARSGISCAVRPWRTAGGHGVMVISGLAALAGIVRRRGR